MPLEETLTATRPLPDFKPVPMRPADADVQHRADGTVLIRSNHEPLNGPRSIAHLFAETALAHADQAYLKQRAPDHGPWRTVTYGQALRTAEGIAQWLLDQGLTAKDSVLILSANSIEHALMTLGCYLAGVPAAPISPAYALISTDHAKLKHAASVVKPKVVFAQSGGAYARAFATLRAQDPSVRFVTVDGEGEGATAFAGLAATEPTEAVVRALDSVTGETVAKYLFTSGSTGMPKCVPQTHAMMSALVAAQNGLDLSEPEPDAAPPETLEWMPWSHISGGNVGFNNVIRGAGTLYLDDGKPVAGLFETTIKNLYEVSPKVFGSAPIAFSMLAAAMEEDPKLRASFFKNLNYMMYGGATLSDDIYARIQALAIAETGQRIPLMTMYGATETQGITMVHWQCERVGLIGLPVPGITLKLVPNGSKMEVRVKGPTVASGYHLDPEKTAAAFDEEGFYRLGDAARFIDPQDPGQGLVFDGRVTEDFKLDSGTWVSVGTLRPDLITACSPLVADAVICGQDKPFVGALFWPSAAGVAAMQDGTLADQLRDKVAAFNADCGGSSRRIGSYAVLTSPPSLDAGEITDKGYVNQRAAQDHRSVEVAALFTAAKS
ncbi:AMP-binding protein [soil metagenome]